MLSALVAQRTHRLCALSRHLSQSSLNLPIIERKAFADFKLTKSEELTKLCESLRSMKRERISEEPVVEALYTANGQSILGDGKLCSDVLLVRYFYEQLFRIIRRNTRVVLTGNRCKSV